MAIFNFFDMLLYITSVIEKYYISFGCLKTITGENYSSLCTNTYHGFSNKSYFKAVILNFKFSCFSYLFLINQNYKFRYFWKQPIGA